MFSSLSAKLGLVFVVLALLGGGIAYSYSKYVDYKKAQEQLIRKDERGIVEKEVNEKTSKVIEQEKKKVKDLQRQLADVYKDIDKRAETQLEKLRAAQTETELNSAYQGVIRCLEKSCS